MPEQAQRRPRQLQFRNSWNRILADMASRAVLVLCLALIASSCARPRVSEENLSPLEGFDWLVGCWLSRDGVVERWEPAAGAAMSGSTLVPDIDGAHVAQSLRIAAENDRVSFSARIDNQPAHVHPLVSGGVSQAVFEDGRNLHLQKITYSCEGETLTIVLRAGDEAWASQYEPCASGVQQE